MHILFALSVIHDLDERSVVFVLAFPQAPLDIDVFMKLPYSFSVHREQMMIQRVICSS